MAFRRIDAHPVVSGGVVIAMMSAKQEGVYGGPVQAELDGADDG